MTPVRNSLAPIMVHDSQNLYRRHAKKARPLWVLLLWALASTRPAPAQTVYRCADTYTDHPCPQASEVRVEDARSAQQKSDSDQATRRTAALANALEANRLKEEKILALDIRAAQREEALRLASARQEPRERETQERAKTSRKKKARSELNPSKHKTAAHPRVKTPTNAAAIRSNRRAHSETDSRPK